MFLIARLQISEGLKDAKLLIMAVLILLAFTVNGLVYSTEYSLAWQDYTNSLNATNNELDQRKDNLQTVVNFTQDMIKPPSVLAFVNDGGETKLPNAMTVNAFISRNPEKISRGNEMLATIPNLDWSFIIGTLMTLMVILLSFPVICGEKKDGTLKLLLSYSVTRSELFFGKFFGLLTVSIVILILGVLLNFTTILLIGIIPISMSVIVNIGWILVFSILCLSLFIGVSILVSSITTKPAISLVILLIAWIIFVIAVPGLAKLFGEQTVSIPSNFEKNRELEKAQDDNRRSHPNDAGNWNGDPFAENIPRRAAWVQDQIRIEQQFEDEGWNKRIQQAETINGLTAWSPTGLLNTVFEEYSGTGLAGFKSLLKTGHTYRNILHEYTKKRDALDKESPHLIYSWGSSSDRGVFSTKAVELSTFPRSWDLWREGGAGDPETILWYELGIYLLLFMIVCALAFVALSRYDPR